MASSKSTIGGSVKPNVSAAAKSTTSKAGKGKLSTTATMAPEQDRPSMSEESLDGIVELEDRWFSPKVIGAIYGLDEKWLSSIREGLKGIDGPPFKKLGTGKSAPIRYNYGKFKEWFDNFPSLINTQGKLAARSASVLGFFADRDEQNQWLFADVDGEPQDFVVAVNSGAFDGDAAPEVLWLTYWQWLPMAAKSGRMSMAIDKALSEISARAVVIHEDDDFKLTVPKGKPGGKTMLRS